MSLNISKRGDEMPDSPIRKLAGAARAAEKKGLNVYKLNIGQPDIPTPHEGIEVLSKVDRKVLEYSPSEGIESLRSKMAMYYENLGLNIDKDDIIVTTGGSEAIMIGFLACFDPGDEIIIPEPAYANYIAFARAAGLKVLTVTSRIEDAFALPPIEEFERKITSRTKAILICNPNNPTGYVYSRDELSKLVEIVKKHSLFLFSDEVYREFCYTNEPFCSILSFPGIDENAILIDSVSKRYNECGIRIGALVTKNEKLRRIVMKFCQARLSPPLLGQLVAEASINAPQSYMQMVYDEYLKRRDFLIKRLNEIPGVFAPIPNGAFYTVASLPVADADHFCRWCLENFEYKGETIFMAPASGFYISPEIGLNQVRIAYVNNIEYLGKAMDILEKALESYVKL